VVGTFSMNTDFAENFGYLVSPDGSKVLLGDGVVMGIDGSTLGEISMADVPPPAVWADDSDHLCGVSASGEFVELNPSGSSHVITHVAAGNSWVIGCSPAADRAVVSEDDETIDVIQMSTGELLASHPWAAGVVTHDCSLFASDGANDVTIRNVTTWAVVGQVFRESGDPGTVSVAQAVGLSWDGSRLVLTSTVFPPVVMTWVVSLSDGATLFQSMDAGQGGFGSQVIPLQGGPELLVSENNGTYLLGSGGQMTTLPG
jgi:hypothetical protein